MGETAVVPEVGPGTTTDRHGVLAVLVAGAAALILILVGFGLLDDLVPGAMLSAVRVNAEALAFVGIILVAVTAIESRSAAVITGLAVGLGVGVVTTTGFGDELGLPTDYLTLREPFLAGVVCFAYLLLPAHHRRRPWLYVGLLIIVAVGELPIDGWHDGLVARWIVIYAEAAGMIALTVVLLDWVLPWPVDGQPVRWGVVTMWMVALVALAGILVLRNPDGVDDASAAAAGFVEHVELWLLRNLESCIAAVALTVWFSIRCVTQSVSSIREASSQTDGHART